MTDLSWPVQQTVFTTLTGNAGIQVLLGSPARVYDHVPTDATFPYLTIGDDTAREAGAKTFEGQEITLTLHAWSRQRGRNQTKDILAAAYTALHDQSLSLTGGTLVNLRYEFSDTFLDTDGLTYHGVARYRAVVCD